MGALIHSPLILPTVALLLAPPAAGEAQEQPVADATAPKPAESPKPDSEEEVADFAKEEAWSDRERDKMMTAAGAGGDSRQVGFKLFVDMLADYRVGERSFAFRPNHTYVILQVSVEDDVGFLFHISEDPIFYELEYNLTPRLSLLLGKLFVPFGINDFHHIIGGRVDEQSHFLPETWGDFGLGVKHVAYDGPALSAEYVLYAVNGFKGTEEPVIASGTPTDNNFSKGLGSRVRLSFLRSYVATASTYYDVWDADDEQQLLFYALGGEVQSCAFGNLPVLNRMSFRGEWARGEIQVPGENFQRGILKHAFARSGYFAEMNAALLRNLVFRVRAGRINPDNTVTDDGDIEVYEPAILIGQGKKIWWTVAYQFTARPGLDYDPENPADVAYAKFFLMY